MSSKDHIKAISSKLAKSVGILKWASDLLQTTCSVENTGPTPPTTVPTLLYVI